MRKDDSSLKAVLAARAILMDATPLKRDCGRLCSARCCSPDEDGRGGMLLFPGEEACYRELPEGFALTSVPEGILLTCGGTCQRERRPLACRVFPLMFTLKEGRPSVRMDPRAWPVCPLMPSGETGLSEGFVSAALEAATILAADPSQRAFLESQQAFVNELTRAPWTEVDSV